MSQPYIRLKNICKSFGSVQANKDVSIDVSKGEILALLGENGSGKSTLVNMLSGIYTPDSGEIEVDGRNVVFHSPKDAIKAGIGMIHQHFKLVDVLTAAENIVIGQDKGVFTSKRRMNERINELCERYGIKIDPQKKIYDMSVSEKQSVEILKILYRGADVLILDEPTAVLTPQEITALFDILRGMKERGCCIIIITHKMAEVMEISDRVTVLRKGESVATVVTAQSTPQQLTEMMVGGAVSLEIERPKEKLSEKPLLCTPVEAIPIRTSPALIFSPVIRSFSSTTPTAKPARSYSSSGISPGCSAVSPPISAAPACLQPSATPLTIVAIFSG